VKASEMKSSRGKALEGAEETSEPDATA